MLLQLRWSSNIHNPLYFPSCHSEWSEYLPKRRKGENTLLVNFSFPLYYFFCRAGGVTFTILLFSFLSFWVEWIFTGEEEKGGSTLLVYSAARHSRWNTAVVLFADDACVRVLWITRHQRGVEGILFVTFAAISPCLSCLSAEFYEIARRSTRLFLSLNVIVSCSLLSFFFLFFSVVHRSLAESPKKEGFVLRHEFVCNVRHAKWEALCRNSRLFPRLDRHSLFFSH